MPKVLLGTRLFTGKQERICVAYSLMSEMIIKLSNKVIRSVMRKKKCDENYERQDEKLRNVGTDGHRQWSGQGIFLKPDEWSEVNGGGEQGG